MIFKLENNTITFSKQDISLYVDDEDDYRLIKNDKKIILNKTYEILKKKNIDIQMIKDVLNFINSKIGSEPISLKNIIDNNVPDDIEIRNNFIKLLVFFLYQMVDVISNSSGFGNVDFLLTKTYFEINKLTYSNLKKIMILKQTGSKN